MTKNEDVNAQGYEFSPTELTEIGTKLFEAVSQIAQSDPSRSLNDDSGDAEGRKELLSSPRTEVALVLSGVLKDIFRMEMANMQGLEDANQLDAFAKFVVADLKAGQRKQYLDILYEEILAERSITEESGNAPRRKTMDKVMKLYAQLKAKFDERVSRKTFKGERVEDMASRREIESVVSVANSDLRSVQEEVRAGLASDIAQTQKGRESGATDQRRRYSDPFRGTGT